MKREKFSNPMDTFGAPTSEVNRGRLHCAFVIGLDQFARLSGPEFDFPEPLKDHLKEIAEFKNNKARKAA